MEENMEAVKAEVVDESRQESDFFCRMNRKSEHNQFVKELDEDLRKMHGMKIRYDRAKKNFRMSMVWLLVMVGLALAVYAAAEADLMARLLMSYILPPILMAAGWNANAAYDSMMRMEKLKKARMGF